MCAANSARTERLICHFFRRTKLKKTLKNTLKGIHDAWNYHCCGKFIEIYWKPLILYSGLTVAIYIKIVMSDGVEIRNKKVLLALRRTCTNDAPLCLLYGVFLNIYKLQACRSCLRLYSSSIRLHNTCSVAVEGGCLRPWSSVFGCKKRVERIICPIWNLKFRKRQSSPYSRYYRTSASKPHREYLSSDWCDKTETGLLDEITIIRSLLEDVPTVLPGRGYLKAACFSQKISGWVLGCDLRGRRLTSQGCCKREHTEWRSKSGSNFNQPS